MKLYFFSSQFTQIRKEEGPPSSFSSSQTNGGGGSVAPVLMRFQRGCQQVSSNLELLYGKRRKKLLLPLFLPLIARLIMIRYRFHARANPTSDLDGLFKKAKCAHVVFPDEKSTPASYFKKSRRHLQRDAMREKRGRGEGEKKKTFSDLFFRFCIAPNDLPWSDLRTVLFFSSSELTLLSRIFSRQKK